MPDRKSKPKPTAASGAAAKRPAHRPAFEPTKEQRETVKVMVAGGIQQPAIAGALGISEPTLRKHFRAEIDHGAAQVNAIVVAAHLKRIQEGDVRAIEWWEKSRMGWSEKTVVDDNRPNERLHVTVTLVGPAAPAPATIDHEERARPGFEIARRHVHLVG